MTDSLTSFTQGIPALEAIPEAKTRVFLNVLVGAGCRADIIQEKGEVRWNLRDGIPESKGPLEYIYQNTRSMYWQTLRTKSHNRNHR